ncbi:TetR/AcrR family transcriptional regulator [Nonomuraea sp. NPDC049421]|uniref:TetR/AcrR family transcriptional regulator n=1 Tax=Nonomuraea sp. NPDC049421 TaxID=3155275 RepID=UPI003437C962
MATVARRLGVRPPSLYKHFPSRHAIYDELFRLGQEGLDLAASLIAGLVSQQLANQPGATYEQGRFTRLVPRLPDVLAAVYPPP